VRERLTTPSAKRAKGWKPGAITMAPTTTWIAPVTIPIPAMKPAMAITRMRSPVIVESPLMASSSSSQVVPPSSRASAV
jgi:hypothetical protein